MQVRCVRPFSGHKAGDVVTVPDGATVSPVYFEPVPAPVPQPAPAPAAPAPGTPEVTP